MTLLECVQANISKPFYWPAMILSSIAILGLWEGGVTPRCRRFLLFWWMWNLLTPPRDFWIDMSLLVLTWILLDVVALVMERDHATRNNKLL